MDSIQAFEIATGINLNVVSILIVSVGCVIAFYWAGWALLSSYKGYTKDQLDGSDLGAAVLRVFFLLIILLWVFL